MADLEEIRFAQFLSKWLRAGSLRNSCELVREFTCRRGWASEIGRECLARGSSEVFASLACSVPYVVRMWLFVGRPMRAKLAAGGDPTEFGPDSDAVAARANMKIAWAAYHKYAPAEMR